MVAFFILSESPDEALSKLTVPLGYVCDSLLFEHGLNWVSIMGKQKPKQRNFLVVQWLGLSAHYWGLGATPGQDTEISAKLKVQHPHPQNLMPI